MDGVKEGDGKRSFLTWRSHDHVMNFTAIVKCCWLESGRRRMGVGEEKREAKESSGTRIPHSCDTRNPNGRGYRAGNPYYPQPSTSMDARKLLTFFPNIVPLFYPPYAAIVGRFAIFLRNRTYRTTPSLPRVLLALRFIVTRCGESVDTRDGVSYYIDSLKVYNRRDLSA